ncbi:MAG TPA: hypothetical protein VKZ54_06915, partial [Membranihabitans sp.]|nr:hypothetical protein [Membranihabitans sp.]
KLDSVSDARQYRAIGNAVPPVLMWHIANSLGQLIEKDIKQANPESHTHLQFAQANTSPKTAKEYAFSNADKNELNEKKPAYNIV